MPPFVSFPSLYPTLIDASPTIADQRKGKGHYGVHRIEIIGERGDIDKIKRKIGSLETSELLEYFTNQEGMHSDIFFSGCFLVITYHFAARLAAPDLLSLYLGQLCWVHHWEGGGQAEAHHAHHRHHD